MLKISYARCVLLAACILFSLLSFEFAAAQQQPGGGAQPPTFEIAPMVRAGDPTPGRWTKIDPKAGIFPSVLARIGIQRCQTNPSALKGTEGFLDFTANSLVLNAGGNRATFGWFSRVGPPSPTGTYSEFFMLFSYDKINGKCVTEIFTWGPFTRDLNGKPAPAKPALIGGFAIDKDDKNLSEVPLDIADMANFLGGMSRPVTAGVAASNSGCLACHNGNGADRTFPFPWK